MQHELTGSNGMRFVRFKKAQTGVVDAVEVLINPASVVSLMPIKRGSVGAPREHTLIGFESGFSFEVMHKAEEVVGMLSGPSTISSELRPKPAEYTATIYVHDEQGMCHAIRCNGPFVLERKNKSILCNSELIAFEHVPQFPCSLIGYIVFRNGDLYFDRGNMEEHKRFAKGELIKVACERFKFEDQ